MISTIADAEHSLGVASKYLIARPAVVIKVNQQAPVDNFLAVSHAFDGFLAKLAPPQAKIGKAT